MKIKSFNIYYAYFYIVLSLLILVSCSEEPEPNPSPISGLEVDIPKTTKVLDNNAKRALIAVDSVYIIFATNTEAIDNIEIGDVIASDIVHEIAPYGLLRKVLAKRKDGSKIVFETRQALLTEAITNGEVSFSSPLLISDTLANGRMHADAFNFRWNESIEGGLNYDIKIQMQPSFDFNIRIKNKELEYLDFKLLMDNENYIKIYKKGVNKEDFLNKVKVLDGISFNPKVVHIGIVPIVLTPKILLLGKAQGSLDANLSFGYTSAINALAGAAYEQGIWKEISSVEASHGPILPTKPELELNFKGSLGYRFQLGLYEIYDRSPFRAHAEVNEFARINVAPLKKPRWSLYSGEEINVGVSSDLFPKFVRLNSNTIYNNERLIASDTSATRDTTDLIIGQWKGVEIIENHYVNGNLVETHREDISDDFIIFSTNTFIIIENGNYPWQCTGQYSLDKKDKSVITMMGCDFDGKHIIEQITETDLRIKARDGTINDYIEGILVFKR